MAKITVSGFLLVLLSLSSCFAQSNQTDSISIATYYPSPYGVYRNLRLYPTTAPANPQPGTMYSNGTEVFIYKGAPVNDWQAVGSGEWTRSGNDIVNSNAGNVVINATSGRLLVNSASGDIVIANGTLLLPITTGSSSAVNGALRFTGTGFEGYYGGKWNPLAGGGSTTMINASCGPGGCGASPSCAAGTLSGTSSSATAYTWKCLGIGGGSNTTCSAPKKPGAGIYAGGCPACLTQVSCRYGSYSGGGGGYYCSDYYNVNGCGPWPATHPPGCQLSDSSTWYTMPPTGWCKRNECSASWSVGTCTSPLTVIECNCR